MQILWRISPLRCGVTRRAEHVCVPPTKRIPSRFAPQNQKPQLRRISRELPAEGEAPAPAIAWKVEPFADDEAE